MDPLNDKYRLINGFWKVNELPEEKSKEDFFLKLFYVIFLSETWHSR